MSIPILLILNSASFAAENKNPEEERLRQMERGLFTSSGSQDRVLRIGLVDCILYALKKNNDILIKKIEPELKGDDVKVAKADFEPTFTADYTAEDNTVLAGNTLQGSAVFNSNDRNLNAGVSGKMVTGTEYSIDFLNKRYKSDSSFQIFNPYYTVTQKLTITQPLLKGFGILVNKADILIAKNDLLQSDNSFQNTVMDTISKVKSSYYLYIFFLETYTIERLSLERVSDLLEINKARYAKGLVSSVDVLEAEAAVAQREKTLLTAESALKKAEDELKLVTNIVDDPEIWNAKIELIDQPEFKKEEVNLALAVDNAFKYRPDYDSAKIDLKNRDIKIKVAKNSLLPTLDLTGSFGLNGLGKDYENALQKANINFPDLSGGFKISIPWGGADRAKYDQRKLEKAQALISLKRLEQNIILEVRDKVRDVDIQSRQVEVAKILREKEAQNYNAQKERYAAGQVSTHDMLDYQDKLSQAELGFIKALIDYNITLINLDKAQGLTLAKNNVKLEG